MRLLSFEQTAARLRRRVAKLPSSKVATLAACCSERHIALYAEFQSEAKWGDSAALRTALDTVWLRLSGQDGSLSEFKALLRRIDRATPDGDRFGSLLGTLAQNVCSCTDSTVRWCIQEPGLELDFIEYCFESIRTGVCFATTGLLDVGSGPEEGRLERRLRRDKRVARERALQEADYQDLKRNEMSASFVERLRARAVANRWSLRQLIR